MKTGRGVRHVAVLVVALSLGCGAWWPFDFGLPGEADSGVAVGDAGGGGGGGGPMGACPGGAATFVVSGNITTDTTWVAGCTYILDGLIQIGQETGTLTTLTIPPGTLIRGNPRSAIVVTRNGRLVANGTASAPIIMTASFPPGTRGLGSNQWGGIVMNGRGDTNLPGKEAWAEGLDHRWGNRFGGGTNVQPNWNCGTLRYVRIEFAGEPMNPGGWLLGLHMNSCGRDTTIQFVQVHRGIDDGVEIFGGNVDLKNIVISGSDDDQLAWDYGWTGRGQFIVTQQYPRRGNNSIEGNSNRASQEAMPRSNPILYNMTLLGRFPDTAPSQGQSRGMRFGVGTAGNLKNLIVANHTDWAMSVEQASTEAQWLSGALNVTHSIFFNNGTPRDGGSVVNWQSVEYSMSFLDGGSLVVGPVPNDVNEADELAAPTRFNRQVAPQLEAPYWDAGTRPNFRPRAGSPALTGGATPPDDGFFDVAATFVGAIGTTDWTAGWTAYPEN